MIIRVAPSGSVSCEISDFRIVVDPGPRERAASGEPPLASLAASEPRPRRGDLVLKTQVELPLAAHDGEPRPRRVADSSDTTINRAGEYEISGVKVKGFTMESEPDSKIIKTTYLVRADGINLCFLDGIAKEPDDVLIEKLGEVDVLFLSADKKSVEPRKLASLVKEIEPHVVVSINEAAADSLSEGLGKKPEIMDRLVIKRKDLDNEEGTKLVWIKEK